MGATAEVLPDIRDFERKRFENYIREKNFLEVEKVDDETFEVRNPMKNVMYTVTKNMTADGVIYAECTCKDFTGRCIEYEPIPAKCKHIIACLDWRRENPQQNKQQHEEREEPIMGKQFDPQKYLIKIKGKDYLEVKFRIHWFRQEKPDWGIRTEIVKLDLERGVAIIRADVFDEQGQHKSSGIKMEYQKNFFDFAEKAETGSIGRALAALGYGTLQCFDMDEGLEKNRIVDAPVQLSTYKNKGNGRPVNGKSGNGKNSGKIVTMPPEEINRVIKRW